LAVSAAKLGVSAIGVVSGSGVCRCAKVAATAFDRSAPSKANVLAITHRSKKSFMRLLARPSETSASSFSATTVSGG
jgi:hypothetical protein